MNLYTFEDHHIKVAQSINQRSGAWAGTKFVLTIGQESIEFTVTEPLNVYLLEDPHNKFHNLAAAPGSHRYISSVSQFSNSQERIEWIPESHYTYGQYLGLSTPPRIQEEIYDIYDVRIEFPVILLNMSLIRNEANDLMPDSPEPVNDLANIIFLHELGHHILDPEVKILDPYINEGFANYFAYTTVNSDYGRMTIERMAISMEPKYNYFYLLPVMEGLTQIFELCRQGNLAEASDLFRHRAEPCIGGTGFESSDSVITVTGSVGGFLGFGCKRNLFLVGETTYAIANIRSTVVIANHITNILGFIDPMCLIVSNSYDYAMRYPLLTKHSTSPIHSEDQSIWLIPKEIYDIGKHIQAHPSDNERIIDHIGEIIRKRI